MRALSVALILALTTSVGAAAEHTKEPLSQVKKNVAAKKAVIIDVREKREWEAGHLVDAKLIPLSTLAQGEGSKELAEQLARELPKGKVIYCHCKAGGRALTACDILTELGYEVRPLKAGYQDLIDAGFSKAK
jgi:rhodanese-related sulfurtransferase